MAGVVDQVLPRTFSPRGTLLNVAARLFLRFQFNPHTLKFKKEVNNDVENIPGWDHPDILYVSGGAKEIHFDLLFDRTPGSADSGFSLYGVGGLPLVGTQAVIGLVESFLYPPSGQVFRRPTNPFTRQRNNKFVPPPDAMLVIGPRFWRVRMKGGQEIADILFDKTMTPVRTTVPMHFYIIEEGRIHDINATLRDIYAAAGAVETTVHSLITDLGGLAGGPGGGAI
jgi:hypothetical protein